MLAGFTQVVGDRAEIPGQSVACTDPGAAPWSTQSTSSIPLADPEL